MWKWLCSASPWYVPLIVAAAILWVLGCMILTGCAGSGPVKPVADPQIQMLANKMDDVENSIKTEISTSTQTATAQFNTALKTEVKELKGGQNIGAFSGGGGLLLLFSLSLVVIIVLAGLYVLRTSQLANVAGAVKAAAPEVQSAITTWVKENMARWLRWLFNLWLTTRGLKV